MQSRRNLELKAMDPDPSRSVDVCAEVGAVPRGTLTQEDIYFNVPQGRLKLRRENESPAHLIAYQRPDLPDQRESRYRIVEISDDRQLEAALSSVLSIKVVVAKTRRLFMLGDVRIHLDRVDGLGDFIEFEAVAAPEAADLADYEAQLVELRHAFGINDAALIGESYCDLALAAAATGDSAFVRS